MSGGGGAGAESASDEEPNGRWIASHGILVLVTAAATYVLPGGPPWFLTASANLLFPLAALSLIALPVSLLRRRFGLGVLQVTALLVAAFVRLENFDPSHKNPPSEESALWVTSINLGVGLAEPEQVVPFLRGRADLVCMLELTSGMAASLDRELGEEYPYRALYPGGIDGKGVLSKFPILTEERFALEEGRSYVRFSIEVDGEVVEAVLVHLAPSIGIFGGASPAARDLEAIARSLDSDGRTLIVGDFNSTWRSDVSADLRALGFREAFHEAGDGPGLTFPVFGRYFGLPVGRFLRVDHVWYGRALSARWACVGPDVGSDHLPVCAAFRIRGSGQAEHAR